MLMVGILASVPMLNRGDLNTEVKSAHDKMIVA